MIVYKKNVFHLVSTGFLAELLPNISRPLIVCVCVCVCVHQAALAESSLSLLNPSLVNPSAHSLNMLHVGHDDVSSTVEQVNSNSSCSPTLSPQQYR